MNLLVMYHLFKISIAIAYSSVIPTAASSQALSTVENFPDAEVLNRNKDDIERGKQVKLKENYAMQKHFLF